MKKHVLLRNGIVASAMLFASISAYTSSSQSPANRSGSPASNSATCASSGCHSGPSASDQSIIISTDIPATGFKSNTDYTITITGDRGTASAARAGFTASVETNSGFEGMISTGGSSGVTTVGLGNFASHAGTQSFSGSTVSWSFTWNSGNAPDGTTIYTAVNFANGNGTTSGDVILSETLQLMKDQNNVSIAENNITDMKVFPNPAQEELNISFTNNGVSENTILLIDLQGRVVKTLAKSNMSGVFNKTYSINDLSAGLYILTIQNDKGVIQERITVQ